MLNQMYPGNFAAFYSTTTWTRSSAAYLAATGNMPPPVPMPLALQEYSQALAASLAQAGHPAAAVYPLGLPMPLNLAAESRDKARPKSHSITKFTIDEILGNKDTDDAEEEEDDDDGPEDEEIEVDSLDTDDTKDHTSASTSPRAQLNSGGDRLSPCSPPVHPAPCNPSLAPVTADPSDPNGDPNARFSWLQCTRYKPPKLPRKSYIIC